jgi:hypothetical protein
MSDPPIGAISSSHDQKEPLPSLEIIPITDNIPTSPPYGEVIKSEARDNMEMIIEIVSVPETLSLGDSADSMIGSPLQDRLAHLTLREVFERQGSEASPPADRAVALGDSDHECVISCESEGEYEFVGVDLDDSNYDRWTTISDRTVDSELFSSLLKKLTKAYLQDLQGRVASLRQRAGSSHTSASRIPEASNSTTYYLTANTVIPKRKRTRDDEEDDSSNEETSHKRSKRSDRGSQRKLFACPYCKYNKRRQSEHNLQEKKYRHCATSYSLTISRMKQHLYRVHKRPDFYCSRCFVECDSRGLLDVHSRAQPPCPVSDSPFQEKMTHDQMTVIRRRDTTRDQVASWYSIYETLFPGSSRPDSPYADEPSSDGVEDFEQWFIGQDLVLRDLYAERIMRVLPGLSRYERDVLDTALDSCLSELVRQRGSDFHLNTATSGPSITADANQSIQGTTALEAAEELNWAGILAESMQPNLRAAAQPNSTHQYSTSEVREECAHATAGNEFITEEVSSDVAAQSLSISLTSDDWAMVGSHVWSPDSFTSDMEALEHNLNYDDMPQRDHVDAINQEEPEWVKPEDYSCQKEEPKGKGKDNDQQ